MPAWIPVLMAAATFSAPVRSEHVEARLAAVPLRQGQGQGQGQGRVEVAIVLAADEGWHTYWLNPGDAGLATSVEWKLPKGFTAGPLRWPVPSRFEQDGGVTGFGYAGEVWLLTQIDAPAGWKDGPPRIEASVDWLECADICLKGSAVFWVEPGLSANAAPAPEFEKALARMPRPTAWKASAPKKESGKVRVEFAGDTPASLEGAYFFPQVQGWIEPASPQSLKKTAGGFVLEAKKGTADPPKEIRGVLALPDGTGYDVGSAGRKSDK